MNFTDALKTGKPIRRPKWSVWRSWSDGSGGLVENFSGGCVLRPTQEDLLASDWEVKPDLLPWYQELQKRSQEPRVPLFQVHLTGCVMTDIERKSSRFDRDFTKLIPYPKYKVYIEQDYGVEMVVVKLGACDLDLFNHVGTRIETAR